MFDVWAQARQNVLTLPAGRAPGPLRQPRPAPRQQIIIAHVIIAHAWDAKGDGEATVSDYDQIPVAQGGIRSVE
jgi:hypothetical protein